MNDELYQEEIGKLLAERNVLHAEACQVWTHVPDGYKLASVGNPVEAVRLMVEGLAVLAADGAALRERLAAVEKAFADAEQDRFADIQTALARERARVEAEFEGLRDDPLPEINFNNWDEEGARLLQDWAFRQLDAIDAARERLLEGETRKQWRARKVGGSYQHTGTVVAEFLNTSGQPRIVLEFDDPVQGMLFIYNRDQVEEIGERPENERLMGGGA